MAIKAIDNQAMIQRTAEYAKDHSIQNKKNELMHDYMTVQGRVEEQRQKNTVGKLLEKNDPKVQREREERGGRNPSQGKSKTLKQKKEKEGTAEPESGHIIDIRL